MDSRPAPAGNLFAEGSRQTADSRLASAAAAAAAAQRQAVARTLGRAGNCPPRAAPSDSLALAAAVDNRLEAADSRPLAAVAGSQFAASSGPPAAAAAAAAARKAAAAAAVQPVHSSLGKAAAPS